MAFGANGNALGGPISLSARAGAMDMVNACRRVALDLVGAAEDLG